MTWPSVDINQLNQRAGTAAEVERTMLFVGPASESLGDKNPLAVLNAQSDVDDVLAGAGSVLLEQVRAAQLNGGQKWMAYALMLEAGEVPDENETGGNESEGEGAEESAAHLDTSAWFDAIELVLASVSVEGVLVCTEIDDVSEGRTLINKLHALRTTITNKLGRWIWFIATIAGPNALATPVSWADYLTFVTSLQKDIAANSIQLVPSLWLNEAGVLAGRLCNSAVTVADSPCRVETGELLGLGVVSSDLPVDADGVELSLAYLQAFNAQRLSVPMWYSDYEGMYWSDGLMLEVKGGDYSVIEHVRVVDKVSRRVRIQAIGKIGNRSLNSTPLSIETHQTYFGKVLREMSRSTQINGVEFPGEVQPPKEGDVTITWLTDTRVSIGIVVRPYASPKEITVNIALDTELEA
ncbi:DUF2586 domain-containing protein [Lelliottia nimipressuralis]|uniref:DUF2586 domain-containing protein n=1 Tax=Lelliottia nimipressuralis TaxID=69220 RepID=UPI00289ED7A3|nr:DUF2586 domain-containing protein [Lelliottia nimipressuralis]